MNELQAIQEIVNVSVRNSSYVTVIISSTIFICYTLIVKLIDYFKSKSRSKPLIEMAEAIKENTTNIVKLNTILDKTLLNAERKEINRCKEAIDLGFKALAFRISQECSDIIAHNNIERNKELIVGNLNKLVSTEYYKLYATLSAYEINEVNVGNKLKEEWIKEIANNIIAIIYNGQETTSRITHINDRLNLYINEYSTYINNKLFSA